MEWVKELMGSCWIIGKVGETEKGKGWWADYCMKQRGIGGICRRVETGQDTPGRVGNNEGFCCMVQGTEQAQWREC